MNSNALVEELRQAFKAVPASTDRLIKARDRAIKHVDVCDLTLENLYFFGMMLRETQDDR